MLFFLGLRMMLSQQSKDNAMGKNKRGKGRKSKWRQDEVDDQLTVNQLIAVDKPKKPFENFKLPPPRDAQRKPDDV